MSRSRSIVPSSARRACIAAFAVLSAAVAPAQVIVVSGSREPLAVDRLAADVVVIDAETIRASNADSVGDLLRREAGAQLSRNGGPGQSTGLLLRGAASSQTAVFVDGVRIGSATLGQPSLEGIALDQIERIEVLRGPGSSLYGADAVGGVVQIFTRRGAAAPRVDAQLAVGGYRSGKASATGSGTVGEWDLAAGLSHERSDGVSALRPGDQFGNYNPDLDGYRLDGAQVQIGWTPAAGQRVGLSLVRSWLDSQYDASEFLPPTFAQDNTADFRNRLITEVAALDGRFTLAPSLVASGKLSHGVDDLRSGGRQVDRFTTTRDLVAAQLAWETGVAGQLVGALERGEDKAKSTSFIADVSRRNDAVVVELTGNAGAWAWQGDVRRDDSSDFGGVTTGRLGGSLAVGTGWKLRALAGTTYRAPTFNDLYFPGFGVPTLQPERGTSVEAGAQWRGDAGDVALTVYHNEVRDLIGFESDRSHCPPDPSYDFGCARNVARARLQGATLSAAQRVGALGLKAQLDFVDAKDADTGARLPRRAAHQETLGATWDGGRWSAGAEVLRLGARTDLGKSLAAETTLDLQARWRFASGWTLEAKLLNATDTDIEPARDYQGLGRQAWVGLRYGGTW